MNVDCEGGFSVPNEGILDPMEIEPIVLSAIKSPENCVQDDEQYENPVVRQIFHLEKAYEFPRSKRIRAILPKSNVKFYISDFRFEEACDWHSKYHSPMETTVTHYRENKPAILEYPTANYAQLMDKLIERYSVALKQMTVAEKSTLETKVKLLEKQLECDRPFAQIYRIGAVAIFGSTLSLLVWAFTGVGAPFHPVFALMGIPAGLAAIAMAFMVKRGMEAKTPSQPEKK